MSIIEIIGFINNNLIYSNNYEKKSIMCKNSVHCLKLKEKQYVKLINKFISIFKQRLETENLCTAVIRASLNGRAMSLDHLKLTLTQIGILVKQLHKKNYTETNDSLQKVSAVKILNSI